MHSGRPVESLPTSPRRSSQPSAVTREVGSAQDPAAAAGSEAGLARPAVQTALHRTSASQTQR